MQQAQRMASNSFTNKLVVCNVEGYEKRRAEILVQTDEVSVFLKMFGKLASLSWHAAENFLGRPRFREVGIQRESRIEGAQPLFPVAAHQVGHSQMIFSNHCRVL